MGILSEMPQEENIDDQLCCNCIDCEWEGQLTECDFDTEPDAFKGTDRKYPICPECGGGIDY